MKKSNPKKKEIKKRYTLTLSPAVVKAVKKKIKPLKGFNLSKLTNERLKTYVNED